ncbi:alcohol dehydrogenase catalytic domain-containing protein [Lactobacillus iners]|nr:alcohol dehydrogenase catalytic domain-containing protein [Lactobacillus iners]MDK6197388.1 alcohol dehydrogenase catalytic domain-containing protein [Lactobacillus iners]
MKYLGHEIIGKDMDNGKFVVINPNITCGKCYSCLNGYENLCAKKRL